MARIRKPKKTCVKVDKDNRRCTKGVRTQRRLLPLHALSTIPHAKHPSLRAPGGETAELQHERGETIALLYDGVGCLGCERLSQVASGGLCVAHGGGPRCQEDGCGKGVRIQCRVLPSAASLCAQLDRLVA